MKVEVRESCWRSNSWEAIVSQGNQSFRLGDDTTRDHAEWYAKMFRKALKAHDRAKGKKAFDAQSVGK